IENGKRVERTEKEVKEEIERARAAWKKAHPDAKHGQGPYPFRTTVTVRRDGAAQPEVVKITFDDGSSESVRWDDDARWRRFVFPAAVLAVPVRRAFAELFDWSPRASELARHFDMLAFEDVTGYLRRAGHPVEGAAAAAMLLALLLAPLLAGMTAAAARQPEA